MSREARGTLSGFITQKEQLTDVLAGFATGVVATGGVAADGTSS